MNVGEGPWGSLHLEARLNSGFSEIRATRRVLTPSRVSTDSTRLAGMGVLSAGSGPARNRRPHVGSAPAPGEALSIVAPFVAEPLHTFPGPIPHLGFARQSRHDALRAPRHDRRLGFAFAAREGRSFSSRWTSRSTSSRTARSVDSPEPIEGPRRSSKRPSMA